MGIDSHLSPCVDTQSPKYLEMAQGHISLSATRSVKEDQKPSKKQKTLSEPKDSAPKKRKLVRISSTDMKVHDMPEKTMSPPSPSAAKSSKVISD
jgi:hypothetical protein